MLAFIKGLNSSIVILLCLAACSTGVVQQKNGLNATITGDLKAELTSPDFLHADVRMSTEQLMMEVLSFDLETNREFSLTLVFNGPISSGEYKISEPGGMAKQKVSVELDVYDFDGNIISAWKSSLKGTASLTETSDTRLVGAINAPLVSGSQEVNLSGSLYLLPLPSEITW